MAGPASPALWSRRPLAVLDSGAIAATISDAAVFRCGRQFAAWLGLTPLANSSGGRERQAAPQPLQSSCRSQWSCEGRSAKRRGQLGLCSCELGSLPMSADNTPLPLPTRPMDGN